MAHIVEQSNFKPKWYHSILVRYLMIIIIIITVVAFLAEYFFIILPYVNQTRDGGPLDLSTYEQILDEQEQYLEKLQQLQVESDAVNRAELEKLNFVVANRLDMAAILSQLESLASQTEMELIGLGVNIGGEEGSEGTTIAMNLSFTGGEYRTVKEYLSTIEKNIRIMDVTDLSMREIGNLFSLTVKSYYIE
ncbi:hypothetical protein MYX06_04995 [Patescibacteria group bacterium AH-259-L05]|nr:hypothetical protein [Patescibacteria group bacterium AH-259-L05]